MSDSTIYAYCETCTWQGRRRRTYAVAELNAQQHERENPGHVVTIEAWRHRPPE